MHISLGTGAVQSFDNLQLAGQSLPNRAPTCATTSAAKPELTTTTTPTLDKAHCSTAASTCQSSNSSSIKTRQLSFSGKMILTEYDKLQESMQYIRSITSIVPKIGIVCGSGLGELVNIIENPVTIPYTKIPHFPQSTVVGHSGELVFGKKDGLPLVCMRGRVHLYEGYEVFECIRPIRLMAMLGIEIICVTNAAGNVNKNYKPGDFMIIKDHISFPSLAGENPLRGPHDPRFGDRFVTMSNAYDRELVQEVEDAAAKLSLDRQLKKGVYAMVVGPTYETIAEARALKLLGADAIGMSTVHEIIAAHQMGVRCLGISLLTNDILTDYDSMEDIVEHEHVVDMGARRSKDFIRLVLAFINSVRKEIKVEPTTESRTNGELKIQ